MLYAIIENGGKQYKAVEGAYIDLDLLPDELGQKKVLDKVLLLADGDVLDVGSPVLPNAKVETTIVEHFKGPKIIVFKYRAKQRYRVKTGHRQNYTRVLIDSIVFPGKKEATAQPEAAASVDETAAPEKKSRAKPAAGAVKMSTVKAKPQTGKKSSDSPTKKPATISVEKLELGAKATTALVDVGLKTVAQVAKKLEAGEEKLLEVPGIGAKTVEDIKKKLKKMGF